jgi:hypothetical protein
MEVDNMMPFLSYVPSVYQISYINIRLSLEQDQE